jgi:hypothetical protein
LILFTGGRPPPQRYRGRWSEAAAVPAAGAAGYSGRRSLTALETRDRSLSLVAALGRARRVLDIGCGTGDLVAALATRDCQVTGLDTDETVAEKVRHRLHEVIIWTSLPPLACWRESPLWRRSECALENLPGSEEQHAVANAATAAVKVVKRATSSVWKYSMTASPLASWNYSSRRAVRAEPQKRNGETTRL